MQSCLDHLYIPAQPRSVQRTRINPLRPMAQVVIFFKAPSPYFAGKSTWGWPHPHRRLTTIRGQAVKQAQDGGAGPEPAAHL